MTPADDDDTANTTTIGGSPLELVAIASQLLNERDGDGGGGNEYDDDDGIVFVNRDDRKGCACITYATLTRYSRRCKRAVAAAATTTLDDRQLFRIYVESYGISCTWEVFRHVYLRIDDVEIHAGMTSDTSRQLVYCTRNYYGSGRSEGYVLLCRVCADQFLDGVTRKCENFFLPINNCDTIVPVIMQTSLVWLAIVTFLVGCLISARTQNFFTFALFVPLATLIVTLAYNRFLYRDDERIDCVLSRCIHANGLPNDDHINDEKTDDNNDVACGWVR